MSNISLTGVFSNIDKYQNILVRLDDAQVALLESKTKNIHGNSPLSKFTTDTGKVINTLRVKLSPWQKLAINLEKQFSHLV